MAGSRLRHHDPRRDHPDLGGLSGFAHAGRGGVEATLHQVENHAHYAGLDDVFGIATTYAAAIARGHVFNDANKRTGLTCALTYMERQGISIHRLADLEDLMVDVADGSVTSEELAEYFSAIWELSLSR
ncbi:type II toxin-antitoxin system death-on-curing family toxin [Burkholderia cepacia]|uniref:type II toxin-antitoxin system death-on-curing family toxin n=1 Tax=Burkholderia cepacia TaxID=292 RepID=UPI001E48B25A|nr:type II toxin-antitoxin system death-on-curing family toxin [Burkholderia cepacia]